MFDIGYVYVSRGSPPCRCLDLGGGEEFKRGTHVFCVCNVCISHLTSHRVSSWAGGRGREHKRSLTWNINQRLLALLAFRVATAVHQYSREQQKKNCTGHEVTTAHTVRESCWDCHLLSLCIYRNQAISRSPISARPYTASCFRAHENLTHRAGAGGTASQCAHQIAITAYRSTTRPTPPFTPPRSVERRRPSFPPRAGPRSRKSSAPPATLALFPQQSIASSRAPTAAPARPSLRAAQVRTAQDRAAFMATVSPVITALMPTAAVPATRSPYR
jgi:hypothetical protein